MSGAAVTSNELILTIVPAAKEWQESTLKAAVDVLDSSKQTSAVSPNQSDPQMQAAVKRLRYLGSAGAAKEMAHRMTGSSMDWDFEAGLVGSPERGIALEEMKKLLVEPSFPVTGGFLSTMSILSLSEDIVDDVPEKREEAEAEFRRELISAIGQKRGMALAVSSNTVVEDAAIYSHPLPADLKRSLTHELIGNFDKLPIEKQAELIEDRWPALDHQEMLPLLRKVASRYQDFPQLRAKYAYPFNRASGAALLHWYEMAPNEARSAVIQEILRPKPRFNANLLGILPEKELPEADQILVEHLKSQAHSEVAPNIASLIERYATAAVEPQVMSFLDPLVGKLVCEEQNSLLAYVLKVDPEVARPRLERAMAAGGVCSQSLLSEIAAVQNHGMLQDIAIKSLDDPDPEVVGSAATYLKQFGPASAEEALWARFTAWSERWKGRESELQSTPGHSIDGLYESDAGSKLMEALASGQGWLADEAKLRRLIDLSVGPQQRQQAEQYLRIWQKRPWSIELISSDQRRFHILQYHEASVEAAEQKLLQFPRGSTFQWSGVGPEGEGKVFEEMSNSQLSTA